MPTLRTALVTALVGSISALALALSGCSSSSSPASGSTAATTSGAAASATVAPVTLSAATATPASATSASGTTAPVSAPGKLDGMPKTCPAAAEVMSKLKLTALVLGGTDPSYCVYLFHGDKSAPHVAITFNASTGFTKASFEAGLKQAQKDVKALPGLGDAAFTWAAVGSSTGLSTLSGGTVFSILPTVAVTTADEIALARAIIAG